MAEGLDYIRDPDEIYRRSFALVREACDLSALPSAFEPLALRMVHACGMPEILSDLRWSEALVSAAEAALRGGAPILADCRMVAEGVIRRRLPADNPVLCALSDDQRVPALAREMATTRSAAAVDCWRDHLEGSVVAIGNAPTALFRLLELLDQGAPRPAAILAFPVGFVGAAESKAALHEDPRSIPYVTLLGRRGGSAIAAAAVNALAGGLS